MIVVSMAFALALSQAPAEAVAQPSAPTQAQRTQEGPPAATPPAQASPGSQPLTLEEAIAAAAEKNLDLKAARARLRQADELSWKAWSGYLPQLSAQASYTYNQYAAEIPFPVYSAVRRRVGPQGADNPDNPEDPDSIPGIGAVPGGPSPEFFLATLTQPVEIQQQNQLGAQAELTQAILAPQLWFLIPNASRGEKVAALTVDGVRRDVLFGVAQAFYGVASLRQALQVTERLLEIAQRSERDARIRFQAGTVAKVALLRAEIDRARAEQDLLRARNSYASAKLGLANLLDRSPDFEVVDPPEPDLPADTGTLEETALRSRPDVQAARLQVDVARGNRSAAFARYLPNVGAFARYQISNSAGFTGQSDQYAVGVGLSWKVLDGGLRESDIREAGARIAEAEASAAGAENRVRLEVRQALLDLESARANAVKAKEQRELAAENQRLVDVSYRAGAATAIEQADATAQLRTAEIATTAETLGSQLAALRVLKVAGEFEPRARKR